MSYKIILHFLIFFFLFSGISCKSKNAQPLSGTKDKIIYLANGFKVSRAYLSLDAEAKKEIPADYKAGIGEKIFLQLVIDSGWVNENGRIYPGIYERVESDDKKHLFVEDDMMKATPEGVDAKDGWLVSIMAVLNTTDTHYEYFNVDFRVWDKKGTSNITGSYKLHLK